MGWGEAAIARIMEMLRVVSGPWTMPKESGAMADAIETLVPAVEAARERGVYVRAGSGGYEVRPIESTSTGAEVGSVEVRTLARMLGVETLRTDHLDRIVELAGEFVREQVAALGRTELGAWRRRSHQEPLERQIDPAWGMRFVSLAPEAASDEMQKLWARILAGEADQPGRFSLQTLDVVHNLTRDDAEVFESLSGFVLDHTDVLVVDRGYDQAFLEQFGAGIHHIRQMIDAGLWSATETGQLPLRYDGEPPEAQIAIGKHVIVARRHADAERQIPVYFLTRAGSQLLPLVNRVEPNLRYFWWVYQEMHGSAESVWVYDGPKCSVQERTQRNLRRLPMSMTIEEFEVAVFEESE